MSAQREPLTLGRIVGGKPSLIFYLICGGLAALAIGVGYTNLRAARQSLDWPSTSGEVVRSEVEELVSVSRDSKGKASTSVSYESNVVYVYRVSAEEYRGQRVRFAWESGRSEAEATVAKYPVGTNVSVYYDPADPSAAVLEPGGDVYLFEVLIGLGVFFIAVAAVYVVIRTLVLVLLPGFRIEIDQNMADRVSEARGWRAKWAACNWIQRTALVITFPILGAMLIGWIVWSLSFIQRGIDGYLHPDGAQKWPATSGLVVTSEMKPILVKRSDTEGRGGAYNRYDLNIVIEYRVSGNRHTLRVQRGISEGEQAARAMLARYQRGSYVDVYYNRGDPSEAALTPQDPAGIGLAALGALMLAPWLMGGLVLVWTWMKKRHPLPTRPAGAA